MTREEVADAFSKYGPMVYSRALALLGNQAEAHDMTQEVFIKAFTELPEGQDFTAYWLKRVTTNLCLNRLRDSKRRNALNLVASRQTESETSQDPVLALAIRRALSELEPRCAEAAVCVYVDGMTHEEAATLLGVSRRTVGNLLTRFQVTAKSLLAGDGLKHSESDSYAL